MTDEEYQIRRKYENRNLMQELEWVSHYPPSGMSNQDKSFIRWLAMTAYDKINELEQTSVPVHDIELILDEVAKPQWIPVTERLPEKDIEVLVFAEGKIEGFFGDTAIAISKRYDFKIFTDSEGVEVWQSPCQYFLTDYEITHWMPLPEQPGQKEEN